MSDGRLNKIGVGLCTYKRPEGLRRALDGIVAAVRDASVTVCLVVVDNDGSDPKTKMIVQSIESKSIETHYLIEKMPGISAARNAVFDRMGVLGVRFMAMLDDDEWPRTYWLDELLREQARGDFVVVGGPVVPSFPAEVAKKLSPLSRYWSVLPQRLNKRTFVFCTCNFLIDLHAIRLLERPLFDDQFGLSGGGDTVFFRRLFYAGMKMSWAEKAIVDEEVPASRASVNWMRQRRFRVGNHAAQWETMDHGRLASIIKTVLLIVRIPIYPLLGREPESKFWGWLFEIEKVRGRIASHLGSRFLEYGRGTPGKKNCH